MPSVRLALTAIGAAASRVLRGNRRGARGYEDSAGKYGYDAGQLLDDDEACKGTVPRGMAAPAARRRASVAHDEADEDEDEGMVEDEQQQQQQVLPQMLLHTSESPAASLASPFSAPMAPAAAATTTADAAAAAAPTAPPARPVSPFMMMPYAAALVDAAPDFAHPPARQQQQQEREMEAERSRSPSPRRSSSGSSEEGSAPSLQHLVSDMSADSSSLAAAAAAGAAAAPAATSSPYQAGTGETSTWQPVPSSPRGSKRPAGPPSEDGAGSGRPPPTKLRHHVDRGTSPMPPDSLEQQLHLRLQQQGAAKSSGGKGPVVSRGTSPGAPSMFQFAPGNHAAGSGAATPMLGSSPATKSYMQQAASPSARTQQQAEMQSSGSPHSGTTQSTPVNALTQQHATSAQPPRSGAGGNANPGPSQGAMVTVGAAHALQNGAFSYGSGSSGSGTHNGAHTDRFWNVHWKDLQNNLISLLGAGSFGQVWHACYHYEDVAVKVIKVDRSVDLDSEAIARFKQEVDIQRRLSHTNIVQFRGACCEYTEPASLFRLGDSGQLDASFGDPSTSTGSGATDSGNGNTRGVPMLAIVMEFCRLGNLTKMIKKARNYQDMLRERAREPDPRVRTVPPYQFYINWERRLEVAYGAAAGLEFMHYNGVVHRDFTSYNLLVDYGKLPGTFVSKVCDFNLSRCIPSSELTIMHSGSEANSPAWQSPELLRGLAYGFSSDVYSFGVVLWEVLTLRVPWHEDGPSSAQSDCGAYMPVDPNVVAARATVNVCDGKRLELPRPDEVDPPLPESGELIGLVQRCWEHEPMKRPTMQEVADTLKQVLDRVRARKRAANAAAAANGGARQTGAAGAYNGVPHTLAPTAPPAPVPAVPQGAVPETAAQAFVPAEPGSATGAGVAAGVTEASGGGAAGGGQPVAASRPAVSRVYSAFARALEQASAAAP